jgi:hypothetical protein
MWCQELLSLFNLLFDLPRDFVTDTHLHRCLSVLLVFCVFAAIRQGEAADYQQSSQNVVGGSGNARLPPISPSEMGNGIARYGTSGNYSISVTANQLRDNHPHSRHHLLQCQLIGGLSQPRLLLSKFLDLTGFGPLPSRVLCLRTEEQVLQPALVQT